LNRAVEESEANGGEYLGENSSKIMEIERKN
jgi:hypothetical protein